MNWPVELDGIHSQNFGSFPMHNWYKNISEVNPKFLFIFARNQASFETIDPTVHIRLYFINPTRIINIFVNRKKHEEPNGILLN